MGGKIRVVQGSQGIVVVIDKKNTPDVKKQFPPEGLDYMVTGLNLDDTAQSMMMNLVRGDIARIGRNEINLYESGPKTAVTIEIK